MAADFRSKKRNSSESRQAYQNVIFSVVDILKDAQGRETGLVATLRAGEHCGETVLLGLSPYFLGKCMQKGATEKDVFSMALKKFNTEDILHVQVRDEDQVAAVPGYSRKLRLLSLNWHIGILARGAPKDRLPDDLIEGFGYLVDTKQRQKFFFGEAQVMNLMVFSTPFYATSYDQLRDLAEETIGPNNVNGYGLIARPIDRPELRRLFRATRLIGTESKQDYVPAGITREINETFMDNGVDLARLPLIKSWRIAFAMTNRMLTALRRDAKMTYGLQSFYGETLPFETEMERMGSRHYPKPCLAVPMVASQTRYIKDGIPVPGLGRILMLTGSELRPSAGLTLPPVEATQRHAPEAPAVHEAGYTAPASKKPNPDAEYDEFNELFSGIDDEEPLFETGSSHRKRGEEDDVDFEG